MVNLDNPLEKVGAPRWMIEEAMQDGPEALERLRRHIHNLIGATGRVFHPDFFPNDPRGTYKRVADAAGLLKTVDDITAWADFLLRPDGVSATERERLQALAAAHEAAKWQALLDMLHVVDQFQAAGVDRPSELLFGLPAFDYSPPTTYNSTFLARVWSSHQAPGIIELSPDADLLLSFSTGVVWERGVWSVEHFVTDGDVENPMPVTARHYHDVAGDAQEAQLAGAVPADMVAPLYERTHPRREESAPLMLGMGGGEPVQDSRIVWLQPGRAWWMEALKPRLETGDYGVIMRPTTGELALLGRLLATRPL